ncbi:MAG: phosphoglucosamine mutase [Verrucomicrobiota bacterium]|nr:phosphoglucosamine mutase [Verrucomicrobiota bacterium]
MNELFGTDGIRGVANTPPLTAETALAIGRAAAHICKRSPKRHRIVIGKDTRLSGYMLENALTAGICSMGVDVFLVGPVPTPGIAFITQNMRADAGIVISASHNPYQDNGIKIFSRDGYKLSDELEAEIENLVSTGRINSIRPTAADVGKAYRIDDVIGRYIVFCKNTFPADLTLDGFKLALDCANGATYKVAPIIFSELGAFVVAMHNKPNGTNINDRCGSQHVDDLRRRVLEERASIGLAFDGDGDRLIAVDERGEPLTGDHIIAICAKHMDERGALRNRAVVTTPMSNYGLRVTLKKLGITHLEAKVGDRFVLELMKEKSVSLGGEESGHLIFLDHHTTGDGIVSALQLLAIMRQTGRLVSELASLMPLYPQKLINVTVARKPPLEQVAELQAALTAAERELGDQGRVFIRYSGTQPMCRVMVEGPTLAVTARLAEGLAEIARRNLA